MYFYHRLASKLAHTHAIMSTITLNGSTTRGATQDNLLRPRTPGCVWRCCQAFTCCWRKRKGDKRMVERTTSIYSSQTGSQNTIQDTEILYERYRPPMASGLGGHAAGECAK